MARFTGKQVAEVSSKIGRSARTLHRWIADGCDILDEASLEQFKQLGQIRGKGKAIEQTQPEQSVELGELPPPGEKGAVQALSRLQALEVRFAQRLEAALAKGQAKPIQAARDDYIKISEGLRRYEKEIEESKRDLGHLIPRGDAIDGARASAMWMRLSFHSWLSSFLPEILALAHNEREAKAKCHESFTEIIRVSVKNAKEANLRL